MGKKLSKLFLLMLVFAGTYFGNCFLDAKEKVKVIYETDMCADVDDVGGLAILHALANNQEAEILAVCYNEVHDYGPPAIDAINTWYGRGNIPIGIYKGNLSDPDYSSYLYFVAQYPHDLEKKDAPSALEVYRSILSKQPDSSVTIISVGFLNNINDLLENEYDLISKKVKKLVIMCGIWNDGFNLVRHGLVNVSQNVIENWPTPIVFSQPGGDILTGSCLKNAPTTNPVREAYSRYFNCQFKDRPSWDEIAVLYAVRGLSNMFYEVSSGTGRLENGYEWQMKPNFRTYIEKRLFNSEYEEIIEDLMMQSPIRVDFNAEPEFGWAPLEVFFDASISYLGLDKVIKEFYWDFGDGTTGEGDKVTHLYSSSGEYEVKLTVKDNENECYDTSKVINVYDPIFSPVLYFGDARNYERKQENLWATKIDNGDLRYYLSNGERSGAGSLPGFCFVKDSLYSDFNLTLDFRTGESDIKQAEACIIFGYQDEGNCNYLFLTANGSRLVSVTNNQEIYLNWTKEEGVPDNKYHRLEMSLTDNRIEVTLDDTQLLECSSSRLVRRGRIGFGSRNYSVYFDNIKVICNETSIKESSVGKMPQDFCVLAYPNPFNSQVNIQIKIPEDLGIKLLVYDINGNLISTLVNRLLPAGTYNVIWDGKNDCGRSITSGVYFVKMISNNLLSTKKVVVIK
ncbi:MAG: PKD domain-containing protein [Candidatus Marinimicrobia bacterium]|nr:PKD domain-containing protein [Candidatus Neomarinimicrobiota bacterium]